MRLDVRLMNVARKTAQASWIVMAKKFLEILCVADDPDDDEDMGVDMHGFMVALKDIDQFKTCVTRARARNYFPDLIANHVTPR